jgi:hypothetical protein
MAEINTLSEPQPQLAQLECKFKGPLEKGSLVEFVSDLINLNTEFHYQHKRIWVKSDKCNYYLDNGDGTELINWKKDSVRVIITPYIPGNTFQPGDCVYQNGKIYTAKISVPIDHSPSDYDTHWLCVAGETETYRYLFSNASQIIIYTEIRNPKFEVIFGDFVLDGNGDIVINSTTNLAELINMEIVEADITKRDDLVPNNGIAYEISFYENDVLTVQTSGCINVK